LKYRATRDGFDARNFHLKCDGVSNTLSFIKTTNANIFGAFVQKPWDSFSGSVKDPGAYIFSLVNKEKKPFYAMCCSCLRTAIYCNSSYGPAFGGGFALDIFISSNSNKNYSSHSNFGYSYKHEDYPYDAPISKEILAGSYNFQTTEIEVFTREEK
jgi:hypothetical protein